MIREKLSIPESGERGAEHSSECVRDRMGLGSGPVAVCEDVRGRRQLSEVERNASHPVAPDSVSLLSHCRYNSQKLTELILQFYGIRADMKREHKHTRLSMKVFVTGGELNWLADSSRVTVVNRST